MNAIKEDPNYTVVEYLEDHSGYRCGYCKSPKSNFSHGMWAHRMKVGHYEALIDRGWRRSGKYCYKPSMKKICCPQYTIRCDSSQFKLSNSQKKVLKRMHHFLSHGSTKLQEEKLPTQDSSDFTMKESAGPSLSEHIPANVQQIKETEISATEVSPADIAKAKGTNEECGPSKAITKAGTSICPKEKTGQAEKAKNGESIKRAKKKTRNEAKSIEDYLNEQLPENACHKLEVNLVKVSPDEEVFMDSLEASHRVYHKYQMTIHDDTEADCDESSYHNFLIDSPLMHWKSPFGPSHGYGSFHQQYWLDGELIAVGVLDILPHCISSVYLYYDPKYSFLSLGTYASLREIALTRMLHRRHSELRYYYLGFYIHSCPKMRYKGNYHPSFLLCPETYKWQPIAECLPKLDVRKYSTFATATESTDNDEIALDKIICLHRSNALSFKEYRKKHKCTKEELDAVTFYATNVGQVCAYSMLLCRDD